MPELPEMHAVWVGAENTRVYGMDDDADGAIWFTGSHPKLHRYWPQTGDIDTVPIPEDHGGSQCLCTSGKVYILPQTNAKLTVYHTEAERVEQVDKPFPEANLWYGHSDKQRGLLYLLESARPALVVWDTDAEKGEVLAYPDQGELPDVSEGDWPERLEIFSAARQDGDGWRRLYFDPDAHRFVAEDTEEIPPARPGGDAERYLVSYKDGRVTRLDRETGESHERDVPGWKEDFGFIGGGVWYQGWQLNNLSTYDAGFQYDERTGKYIQVKEDPYSGVDGHPYHFMDRFLAYHPESDTFDLLAAGPFAGRYPQLCYNKVSRDHLYITANDIWSAEKQRPLGSVEGPVGQLMVFQTHDVATQQGKGNL